MEEQIYVDWQQRAKLKLIYAIKTRAEASKTKSILRTSGMKTIRDVTLKDRMKNGLIEKEHGVF